MRFLYLCLFITLAHSQDVTVPAGGVDRRIIGGSDAPRGIFVWQASLRTRRRDQHFCGGSVIDKQYILTSARCATMLDPRDIIVVVGIVKLSSVGTEYRVKSAIVHENFDQRTLKDDIALFKLATPIKFNNYVQPVKLDDQFLEANKDCLVTGWGDYDSTRRSEPDNLQMLQITVLSDKSCIKKFGKRKALYREGYNMCSADKDKGVCAGDYGGPVTRGDTLVGVISFSMGCGQGLPDVYSRVSAYIKWIREHAKE